jgi:hypothetical protein
MALVLNGQIHLFFKVLPMSPRVLPTAAIAILSALALHSSAVAQDALGAGDVLDGNSQVGSGGRNTRTSPRITNQSIRARNYIITDSVAGGRGFRGNVGYKAAGDFTGRLGSDDSIGFRSNSALSDLIYITSPQKLDSYNIAQGTGVFEFRRDFSSLPDVTNASTARSIGDAMIRLDRSTQALTSGTLYSTAVNPEDVGVLMSEDQMFKVTASTLEGLGTKQMNDPFEGYTLFDRAQIRQQIAIDPESISDARYAAGGFTSEFDQARLEAGGSLFQETGDAPPEMIKGLISQKGPRSEAYSKIVDTVLERYADQQGIDLKRVTREDVLRRAGEQMGRIESRITGRRVGDGTPTVLPQTAAERLGLELPDGTLNTDGLNIGAPENALPGEDSEATPDSVEDELSTNSTDDTEGENSSDLTVEQMANILRHRQEITELSAVDESRLSRAVAQGEEALADGRYFKAEAKFDDALNINPGNPILELARANAQIGAGLFLSAALTLERTLNNRPEVIDARFKKSMLPNRTRLDFAVASIRERLKKDLEREGFGLTLAYIGHQIQEPKVIEEGLTFVRGTPRGDAFAELLNAIWLGEEDEDPSDAVEEPETASEPLEKSDDE